MNVTLNMIFLFVVIIITNFVARATSDNNPCDIALSVDISDGRRFRDDETIIKDNITYTKDSYFEYEGKTMGCVCNLKACIKKCCPLGKYMTSDKECVETQNDFVAAIEPIITADISTYSIINVPCNAKSVLITLEEETVFIKPNGNLLWSVEETEDEEYGSYCLDFIVDTDYVSALLCNFEGDKEATTHNSIGRVVSVSC